MYVTSKRAFYYRFTGTVSQVRDSIRRLEEEIAKMTKIIFAAILDDAVVSDGRNHRDVAVNAGGLNGSEGHSEIGRLQKQPGFSRLQR